MPPGAAVLGLSVPGFWLATLVVVLPAIWWGWRPVTGFTEFGQAPLAHLAQFLLPGLILGLAAAAALMRLIRGCSSKRSARTTSGPPGPRASASAWWS